MSSIANLGSAAAALPTLNVHPHGHKRGSPALSATDFTGSDSTETPQVQTVQDLFSNLLRSRAQVIGAQSGAATPAAGAAASTGVQSANTLLQNYLHNAPRNVQAPLQNLVGSKVSSSA
jgi:hypothetical protein